MGELTAEPAERAKNMTIPFIIGGKLSQSPSLVLPEGISSFTVKNKFFDKLK